MISKSSIRLKLFNDLKFNASQLEKIDDFVALLLSYNKKYNLISKNSEKSVWNRHILDSAQLVKHIDFKNCKSIADFGSGAGLPGILLSIYADNHKFHVKLYEKSPVKCDFLNNVIKKLNIKAKVINNDLHREEVTSDYIVARAFKKMPDFLTISREIIKKPCKIIILKGKNAQEDVIKSLKQSKFKYKLEKSITDDESKILILDFE